MATSINDQRNKRKILTDLPSRTHRSQGRPSLQLLFAATHTLQARFTYFLLLERGPSFDGCICKGRTNDDEYTEEVERSACREIQRGAKNNYLNHLVHFCYINFK